MIPCTVMSSRVARVGTEYDEESASSLRVWPGDMPKVEVGQYQCQNVGKPCYYLLKTLPRDVPRCVTNYDKVKQCDDFITNFQGENIENNKLVTKQYDVDVL